MKEEKHDFLQVLFVIEGRALLKAGQSATDLKGGYIYVVPIGQEHQLNDDPRNPLSLYVLSIKPEVLSLAALRDETLPDGLLPPNPLLSSQVEAVLRQLLLEQTLDRPQSGAIVIGLTLQMLAALVQAAHGGGLEDSHVAPLQDSHTRVRSYVADLEGRFFESKPLDEVARDLGMSRRRFTQIFREITGTSWLSYLRKLRVEHARRLLQQTHRTIASIAFECGFEDLSTFYRAFKREVGTSPSRWRQGSSKPSLMEGGLEGADAPSARDGA